MLVILLTDITFCQLWAENFISFLTLDLSQKFDLVCYLRSQNQKISSFFFIIGKHKIDGKTEIFMYNGRCNTSFSKLNHFCFFFNLRRNRSRIYIKETYIISPNVIYIVTTFPDMIKFSKYFRPFWAIPIQLYEMFYFFCFI